MIPTNVGVRWVLEQLFFEDKIPERLFNKYFHKFDGPYTEVTALSVRVDPIPPQVGQQYAQHRLCDLFPASRPQSLPQEVAVVRVKNDKNKTRLAGKIGEYLTQIGGRELLFRASTRVALAALMAFFTPVIHSHSLDNELGPGLYTSNSLEWVLKFGSSDCALLVFKDPDFRDLDVWDPSLLDWQHVVASWTRKSLSSLPASVPVGWRNADVVRAAISKPNSPPNCLPVPSEVSQTVAVSSSGCAALAASLALIIWLE